MDENEETADTRERQRVRDIDGQKRSFVPRWLFYAVVRAILRALEVVDVRRESLSSHVEDAIVPNRAASKVMRTVLSAWQRRAVVGIVSDILQRVRIIESREGRLRLSDRQRRGRTPGGISNRAIVAVYAEYMRWGTSRPNRYKPVLPREASLSFQFPPRVGTLPAEAPARGEYLYKQVAPVPQHAIQRVFFATDRERRGDGAFMDEPSSDDGQLYYGRADVSIPDIHRPGRLERPFGFLGWEFKENPKRHIMILPGTTEALSESEFLAELRQENVAVRDDRALIFVHGYKVSFDDSIRRTAQLANDLGFQAPAIAFSWPSRGKLSAYTIDADDAKWAADHLADLLHDLYSSGLTRVHVISHSMGAQVVAGAARVLYERRSAVTLGPVVFAAADIDAREFKRRRKNIHASRVTLYASSTDAALEASLKVNGNRRAGDARDILICKDVDTVDATFVDTDWLGHGYYCSNTELIDDIDLLFSGQMPPRFLQQMNTSRGEIYWRFRRDSSGYPNLNAALT